MASCTTYVPSKNMTPNHTAWEMNKIFTCSKYLLHNQKKKRERERKQQSYSEISLINLQSTKLTPAPKGTKKNQVFSICFKDDKHLTYSIKPSESHQFT